MSLVAGARLGPYEVVEPLGKGGMGEVYRARDTRLGREVAIKVLPAHTASTPDALARFEFEARAVAGLNHPNILALHDVGVQTGISYAVTELLEGETLRDRLVREGRLPPRKALDLAVQLARGLAAAHGRGIVHRDLKPENLFLTGDGRLKILDFGLAVQDVSARASGSAETRFATEPGTLVGTVSYMSPEQIRGETASVRSDVFSFGVVLHEVLAGSNPFRRDTMPETMAAILRDQPESLAAAAGLPAVAARLIDRCLEKRVDDRPESMRDMALFLESAAETAGAPAMTAGPDAARRITRWTLAGACALILLLTATMCAYVATSANRSVASAIADDLARAETVVVRAQQDRLDRLQSRARLVASIPELKALFEKTDAATIRDFLQNYQQRSPGTPLLVALGSGGYVLARTDVGADAAPERGQEWLATLLSGGGTGIIRIGSRPYHAAVANAEAGGTIFGSVLAAAPVDDGFAQVLREVTEEEAVLLDQQGIAGTSLLAGQVPWKSLDAFRSAAGTPGTAVDVTIGRTRYTAREVSLVDDPPISAVILASRDDITAPFRGMQTGILIIGGIAAALALLAGLVVLRRWERANAPGLGTRDSALGFARKSD
jgi:hypothetical protein